MLMLGVCRRCMSDSTNVESVATYRRKKLAVIRCKNCDNSWVVSVPKECDVTEYINRGKITVATATTQKPETPQTAMSMVFKKALEKKNK